MRKLADPLTIDIVSNDGLIWLKNPDYASEPIDRYSALVRVGQQMITIYVRPTATGFRVTEVEFER